MTTESTERSGSFYIAVFLALLFFVGTILGTWATTPALRKGIGEATHAEAQGEVSQAHSPAPAPAKVEVEAAPVQSSSGDPVAGKTIFTATCAACHGPTGEGVVGLGKDMTTSEFVAGKSDEELVEFIKVGRDPSDPLNTTGVAMPVKGGNPALDDEDLFNVVAFIRTIHK